MFQHKTCPLKLCILLSVVLTGCTCVQVRPVSPEGEQARDETLGTIVLLRIVEEIDGKPRNALDSFGFGGINLVMADLDIDGHLKPVLRVLSPSKEARRNGWVYLRMKPGSYYLRLTPPIDAKPFETNPLFWFSIAENSRQIVYLGTLRLSLTTRGGLFRRLPDKVESIQVIDETNLAEEIAARFLPQERPMAAVLLKDPRAITPLSAFTPPVGIGSSSDEIFSSPNWRLRSLSLTTGLGSWIPEPKAQDVSVSFAPGAIAAGYVLFYLPPATAAGALLGQYSVMKWHSCMEDLANEVGAMDLSSQVHSAFLKGLQQNGISPLVELGGERSVGETEAFEGVNSVLLTEIRCIRLRECKRGKFCIEMNFRIRLFEIEQNRLLFDKLLVYTALEHPGQEMEEKLAGSICRTLEEYCGEEGKSLLRDDIQKGIDSAVENICSIR